MAPGRRVTAPGCPDAWSAWDTTGIYYHMNHTGVKTQEPCKTFALKKKVKEMGRKNEKRSVEETWKEILEKMTDGNFRRR
jgi:hypothetical protein